VAPIAIGNLYHVAAMSELIYIFLQNDFHCSSPISCLALASASLWYPVSPPLSGGKLEARSEGQQRDVARLLDGQAEAALMPCANTSQAARNDFAALRDKPLQQANIAVGDRVDLLGAELANFLAPEELAAAWPGVPRVAGASRVSAARTGCMCVLFSRMRAVGFVSHVISSQVRCAYLRSRPALESLNIQPASAEWKQCSAIVMRCAMRSSSSSSSRILSC